MQPRRVCFVTGTRAEFGLMRATLDAVRQHAKLRLQLVVTGMHLARSRGRSIRQICEAGLKIDRVIPWPVALTPGALARQTGLAMARLAQVFSELKPDIVLVVGDRVEAFAAAAAGHLCGCVVAHVHGGDRAQGQVDDSLRHAITKLAHLHFPATAESAARIARLGEDRARIRCVGSPGLDELAAIRRRRAGRDALLLLHPVDSDATLEFDRARTVLRAVEAVDFDHIHLVYPNTDPGSAGIVKCWRTHARGPRFSVYPNLTRRRFLDLLRGAAVLVGNSSSGIIEAATFGTPVLDIGPRQRGRQRSGNVTSVPYNRSAIRRALLDIWNDGSPRRFRGRNVYGAPGASRKIAQLLASIPVQDRLRRKLIAY